MGEDAGGKYSWGTLIWRLCSPTLGGILERGLDGFDAGAGGYCSVVMDTWLQEAIEGIIRKEWQDFFIAPIQAQCKVDSAPAP
jgi:hypothetical protein